MEKVTRPTEERKQLKMTYNEMVQWKLNKIFGKLGKASLPFAIIYVMTELLFLAANSKLVQGLCNCDKETIPYYSLYFAFFLLAVIPSLLVNVMIWLFYSLTDQSNPSSAKMLLLLSSFLHAQYFPTIFVPSLLLSDTFCHMFCLSTLINSIFKFLFGLALATCLILIELPKDLFGFLIGACVGLGFLISSLSLITIIAYCNVKRLWTKNPEIKLFGEKRREESFWE